MSTIMSSPAGTVDARFSRPLTRIFVLAAAMLLAILGLTFAPAGGPASAAESIAQCNATANTGGLGLNCDVSVINNLDVDTGVASSTVTVTECNQAANTAPICTPPVTTSYDAITSSVDQCNDAANGAGASVVCNVTVTNNITGAAPTAITGATVNQCVGSGAEGTQPTLDCDPFPANTTDATITQCNGSANGGGSPTRVTCSVTPSTMSSQLPVSINQCNGTANGGGSVVTCTSSLTNIALASAVTPTETPTETAAPVGKNTLYESRTDGFTHNAAEGTAPALFLGIGALLLAGLAATVVGVRRATSARP